MVKTEALNFIIEEELANQINTFNIDYKDFFLNRGFQIYADGYNASFC
jgi:Fe-S cluster assembly iron-binding protein IscA